VGALSICRIYSIEARAEFRYLVISVQRRGFETFPILSAFQLNQKLSSFSQGPECPIIRPCCTDLIQYTDSRNSSVVACVSATAENKCHMLFDGRFVAKALCVLRSISQSQSYTTTDGQSTSLSWCQAPILDPRLYSCGFVDVVRPLWREVRSVVFSFAGHCQRSLSQTWVPRDSRAYFIVSLNLVYQVPVFISPRNRIVQLYRRALGLSLSVILWLNLATPYLSITTS
jgi:hypothetical protein